MCPWVIGFLIFTAGPMLSSLYLSFTRYDLVTVKLVGLENYRRLLSEDPLFWKSFLISLEFAVISIPIGLSLSLAIALLLNQEVRGQRLFRTMFYLPSLIPAVASALLWQWIFNADNGLLNLALGWIGIKPIQWLQDARWTMSAFVLMSLAGVGGAKMVIFLAGLQNIPTQLYEAATLDGAGAWSRFWRVTLPMLSPVLFFNLVVGCIGAFQTFTGAYVMTNGGPNNSSLFYALYLFRNAFEYFKLGKASAMAWLLFVFLLAITRLQFQGAARWVYQEGDVE